MNWIWDISGIRCFGVDGGTDGADTPSLLMKGHFVPKLAAWSILVPKLAVMGLCSASVSTPWHCKEAIGTRRISTQCHTVLVCFFWYFLFF